MKYPTRQATALAILLLSPITVLAPIGSIKPAQAKPFATTIEPSADDFEECASTLLNLSLDAGTSVEACGAAREPQDLAACVDGISNNTSIPVNDALAGCVRVRRPLETAECVVSLDGRFEGTLSSTVLGYCGRSLLPTVFKNCVEGIHSIESMDPMMVMSACVEGDYDATQVFLPIFDELYDEVKTALI